MSDIPANAQGTEEELLRAIAEGTTESLPEAQSRKEQYLKYIAENGGTGGGSADNYTSLANKPQINGVTLLGNKSASALGLASASDLADKVDKVDGKGLSTNDYDDDAVAEVEKIADKVDKVTGKGLSTVDFTDTNYVHTDYNYDATAKALVDSMTTELGKRVAVAQGVANYGKSLVVDVNGNVELRKLDGNDISITVDGNAKSIQDSLNVANGLPVLDTNGKILVSQLPTSARKIVGYVDAENVHTLPDGSTYDAGSELIITSDGTITQSTSFTLVAGNKLTEMEVSNANTLTTAGYVFTLSSGATSLGTVKTFATDKVTLSDDSEITLPYASDLSATSVPSVVSVTVAVGDEFMLIDGHWVHLSNTSNVTSVNGKGGAVTLTSNDINVTIDGTEKRLQTAIDNGEIGGGALIDDTSASTDKVYSSSKVESSLLGILKPIPHSEIFEIPGIENGTYMYVGRNNEYLGICFFRLYRQSTYSTQLILWGAGDDPWCDGYDQEGKSFSKLISPSEITSIYLKDSSTFWFTGDSFDSGSNTLYKLG